MEDLRMVFTEMTDAKSEVFKRITINDDLSLKKEAKAMISKGTAKTMELTPTEFVEYLDGLNTRPHTCLVTAVWAGGDEYTEYDICLKGQEDPAAGRVSRTSDFFAYANGGSVSLSCFDIDGDYTKEQVHDFIYSLELILKDAIISTSGNRRLMRFEKPSASARIKVNGKTSNGLHIYIPVKGLKEDLLKKISRPLNFRSSYSQPPDHL